MIPASVNRLLEQFRQVYGLEASLWMGDGAPEGAVPLPGVRDAAILVEGGEDANRHARFLAGVVSAALRHEEESRFFGREIGERYEEITLLYTISEVLGSVISLEQAAETILREVAGTLAVRRATLWLSAPERNQLELVASYGAADRRTAIDVDGSSITATVFRQRTPINLEPGDERAGLTGVAASPDSSILSVPVSYSPPDGETRTIGVINLVGKGGDHRFSAGDQKLMMAIASQIGAAVENNRLVQESLRQERMVREMELAHDLQLKLLPGLEQFEGYAQVAARFVPAESVGGDFYHLFRLPGGRLGVMIGDVSSHGFGAALIMALTMSAVAIHASEAESPAEVLRRTHRTLIDELETTEMYLTLFYGVIDPRAGRLRYANAGHGHAFRVSDSGEIVRLPATNPPLGIVDLDAYGEETEPWTRGRDLLLLFTDGLSDALEARGEQQILDTVSAARTLPVEEILERLYALPTDGTLPADDRTAVLVRF